MAARPTLPTDERLREAYAAGRDAHPRVDLSFSAFAEYAATREPPKQPGDYFLARACDSGTPGAWERLQVRFRRPLLAFLRRRGASSSEAHQLLDDAWGNLAAPPPSGLAKTRVGTYDGRGTLFAWLATVLWRRLADRWRARSMETPGRVEDLVEVELRDPADEAAHEETARLIGASLEDAWSQLTERELRAVVMKYVHGLPQTEIARVLGVGPPRVTRLLQSAARRLRERIEERFEPQPDWDAPEGGWGSLVRSVQRVLARTAATIDMTTSGRRDDG